MELDEQRSLVMEWKEKFRGEGETRHMLDENLKIIGRRVAELETEVGDLKDKLVHSERERKELQNRMGGIYKEQEQIRLQSEDELRDRIEDKDKEIRKYKETIENMDHLHKSEVEGIKAKNKNDLDILDEKVKEALVKKNESIK